MGRGGGDGFSTDGFEANGAKWPGMQAAPRS